MTMSKLSNFYAHRKEMLKGDGQFEIENKWDALEEKLRGHRDRYIGSLFRTSEPVTMIPDGFLNPSVDCQLLFFTEVINLKTLVLDRLFVATNTNITVNHNFFLQR